MEAIRPYNCGEEAISIVAAGTEGVVSLLLPVL